MKNYKYLFYVSIFIIWFQSCTGLKNPAREPKTNLPASFTTSLDTTSATKINWKSFFKDAYLISLIDSALQKNQELNLILQEIEISKNEIRAKKGEYLPSVSIGAGGGIEKEGLFTRHGAVDEQLLIDGKHFPEPFSDVKVGAFTSWEVDVWRKLRNSQKAATLNYLASIEGKNFMVTNLVAEIAETYYELVGLEQMLTTINKNVELQTNALQLVKLQKEAAKATQLAVNRFEAQLLKTKYLQYEIKQKIVEAENQLNFLTARYPTKIERTTTNFLQTPVDSLQIGIPSQLLANRPDIRAAELELAARKLDVKSAKANFYPSVEIKGGIGLNAFNPSFLVKPESFFYNLAGDLMAPLINRNGIKAAYYTANAQQLQAVITYEQSILNGFVDVVNQQNKLANYTQSLAVKTEEVAILNKSVSIATTLFNAARADYVEVLLTQEESLDATLELIEVKTKQLKANISLYRALGGGW